MKSQNIASLYELQTRLHGRMQIEDINWTLWTNIATYVVKPLLAVGALVVAVLINNAMIA